MSTEESNQPATVHYVNFEPTYYKASWYAATNPLDVDEAMKRLYQLYNSEKFKGGSLLDICCGPIVHWLAAPSLKYKDITVSDLLERNLLQIKKWIQKEPDAFDWSQTFKFAADAEGVGDHTVIEERVRRAVKDMLLGDVHKENPLLNVSKTFNVVQCSYGMESASLNQHTFERSVRNLCNVLKPGGAFVILTTLKSTHYAAGPYDLLALPLTREMIHDAFTKAGLEDIEIGETFGRCNLDQKLGDPIGYALCSGFKKH